MPYIIGMLTNIEKAILEKRGWTLERPTVDAIVGPQRFMVFIDNDMFKLMSGVDFEQPVPGEPTDAEIQAINAEELDIKESLRIVRDQLCEVQGRVRHRETNIAQGEIESWNASVMAEEHEKLADADAERDRLESQMSTLRARLQAILKIQTPESAHAEVGQGKIQNPEHQPGPARR